MIELSKLIETQMLVSALSKYVNERSYNESMVLDIKNAALSKRKKRYNKLFIFFALLAYALCCLAVLLFFPRFIDNMIGDEETLGSRAGFVGICVGILFSLIIPIAYKITRAKWSEYEKTRKETSDERIQYNIYIEKNKSIQPIIEDILDQLQKSEIPKKYLSEEALDWMIKAVENKRADSMKELYNLYEQYASEERRHQEQMDAIANISVYNEYNYWD